MRPQEGSELASLTDVLLVRLMDAFPALQYNREVRQNIQYQNIPYSFSKTAYSEPPRACLGLLLLGARASLCAAVQQEVRRNILYCRAPLLLPFWF